MHRAFFICILLAFLLTGPGKVSAEEHIPRVGPEDIHEVIAGEKGRVLILNFWATWCAPCRAEIRELVKIRDMYETDQLSIIGPSLDFDPGVISPFVERMEMNYPVLHATDQVMDYFGIESIPYTLIFNRKGEQTHEFYELVETKTLLSIIEELIQQ